MCNHHQLEVLLLLPVADNLLQRVHQRHLVLPVQIGGRFIQGQHPAVRTERLRQRHADHQRGQRLLSRGAATAHLQSRVVLHHVHGVLEYLLAAAHDGLALDLDVLDVLVITPVSAYTALIGLLPEVGDALVDLADLGLVIDQQGLFDAMQVLVEVLQHLRGQQHLHFDLVVARVDVFIVAGVQLDLFRR